MARPREIVAQKPERRPLAANSAFSVAGRFVVGAETAAAKTVVGCGLAEWSGRSESKPISRPLR